MPYPYYPPRTYDRYVPPSQVILVPPKPPTLQSFTATLFQTITFPTTNLVSYWKLDEASGTRNDSVGTNHLTDITGAGSVTGKQGNAATFDRTTGNFLSCASNSSLQVSGTDFTIAAWVKFTTLPFDTTGFSLVTKDDDAANSRDYTLDYITNAAFPPAAGFRFYVKGGAGSQNNIASSGTVASTGQWYFLVAWYDTSDSTTHLRVDDATSYVSAVTSVPIPDVSNAEFRIGAREYSGFQDFVNGTIDEVGLWKRLLTSTEITALYNSGAGMTYSTAPSASLGVKALKAFTATLSRSAALVKRITDAGFTATLSFVGSIAKRMTLLRDSFTATLSRSAALTRRTGKALSATLSFVGTFAKNFISGGVLYTQSFTATLFGGGLRFTDDFNRADGSLGANWIRDSTQTDLTIVSNACKGTWPTPIHQVAVYTASGMLQADQYAQFKVTTTGGYMGPVLRSDGNGNFYVCFYQPTAGSPVTIYRVGSGSYSSVTAGIQVTPTVGDIVYFEAVGSTLTMKVNGVTVATGTDGTYTGAGYAGIDIYDTVAAVDDFEAGTIGGTGPSATLKVRANKALSATLSFIGTFAKTFIAGSHLFTQSLTATLSSAGALTKRITDSGFTATLSFVGALAKRSTRFLTATLSFTGFQTASKSFLKALTATLSFVGAMSARIIATRAFTATLSFVGASSRRANKAFTATLTFVSAMVKRITDAGFTGTLSFVGSTTKRIVDAGFSATLSFIGNLAQAFIHGGTAFTQSLVATLSFVGNLSAKGIITRAFTATLNATASLSRSTLKVFNAIFAPLASLVRRITRTFSAAFASAGSLVKAIRDAGFSATLSFVGNLVGVAAHFFTRAFTATLSFSATLTRSRVVQRVLTATLAFSGAISRRIGKVFSAALSFSTAMRKAIRKVLRGTLALAGFLFRGGAVTVLAGWITKCLATIGVSGSSATGVRTGSQLTVEKLDESGMKIQITGSTLTVERTK